MSHKQSQHNLLRDTVYSSQKTTENISLAIYHCKEKGSKLIYLLLISYTNIYSICMLRHFSHVWLCETLWTVALQALSSCPWDPPSKKTGRSCHASFQEIFPTQGANPRSHASCAWQVGSLPLAPPVLTTELSSAIEAKANEQHGVMFMPLTSLLSTLLSVKLR